MPIIYNIDPDLNFLLYVFRGYCTADEYFSLYHAIYQNDHRRHHGMRVMMDLLNGTLDFGVESIREAKAIVSENREKGHPRDRVAFLTKSTVLMKTRDAFVLLMGDLPMDLEICHNFHDAIQWLGLADQEQKANFFWQSIVQG